MLTSKLTGQALNWAVATALGEHPIFIDVDMDGDKFIRYGGFYPDWANDWIYSGPIIEDKRITIQFDGDEIRCDLTTESGGFFVGSDETHPLIAAMRCYVASKLGDEVEVPQELA